MDDSHRLTAQLAMFVSGAQRWVDEARQEGLDDEAIEEVEEANQHTRRAFDILEE